MKTLTAKQSFNSSLGIINSNQFQYGKDFQNCFNSSLGIINYKNDIGL